MKKSILIIFLLIGVGAVAFTLYNNKAELNASAERAMKTSEFISVTTEKVTEKTVNRNFEANGVFEPNMELKLMSETSGSVVNIYKRKGDYVRKGDVILKVDDRLIRSEYNIVKLNRDQAEKDLARYANLASADAITKKQFEDSERGFKIAENQMIALQKRLDDTKIVAPIAGFINEDYFELGTLMNPNVPVVDIINTNPLKLKVSVSENEISRVKIGEQVSVTVNAITGEVFTGKIDFIAQKADASFKYDVILLMSGKNLEKIKSGMFGTAAFQFSQDEKVLQISRKSIAGSLKDPGVFLIQDGVAVYQKVVINPLNDGTVEILDGLKAGDEVIASGLINVKEGTKVKAQ
jgi:RND family efflux transporter MFP subunit